MANNPPSECAKATYEWCLDFNSTGKQYKKGKVTRQWTKEEMMAHLDLGEPVDARALVQVQ